MPTHDESFKPPSVLILDLDGTLIEIFSYKNTIFLSGEDMRYFLQNGAVKASYIDSSPKDGKYMCVFLILEQKKLDAIFQLAAKKDVPIIVLTHASYPSFILKALLNPLSKKYKIQECFYSIPYKKKFKKHKKQITQQGRCKFSFIKFTTQGGQDKNGTLYFFNAKDIHSYAFEQTQFKLNQQKNDMSLDLKCNEALTVKFSYRDSGELFGEARKHVSALAAIEIINSTLPESKKIKLATNEDRKQIIFMDDDTVVNVPGARSFGMTTIEADAFYDDSNKTYMDTLLCYLKNGINMAPSSTFEYTTNLKLFQHQSIQGSPDEYPTNPPCVIL